MTTTLDTTRIDAATARRLAVKFQIDPRSISKEIREPGSVRGMAGDRARAAIAEWRAEVREEPQTAA